MTTRVKQPFLWVLLLAFALVSMAAPRSMGQTKPVRSLITERIDETHLTVLRGNTHPLARPEFDRGLVSPSMPLQHLFLVLQRSPEQAAALQKLLAEQQDPASPNYQKWLTPVEFGQQFGPSDQDIQTVVQWLQSRGLQVERPTIGRTVVEFSGGAAQVQQAFHTEIHNYEVNGKMHWANSYDPSIPSALTPVVVGVKALHDFNPRPMSHPARPVALSNLVGRGNGAKPLFTIPTGCQDTQASPCSFALSPADFGTIYSASSLWSGGTDGTGQTIAVMGQAYVDAGDLSNFRILFGLPTNAPNIMVLSEAPLNALGEDINNENESDLDLEWAGAIAPRATIDFITSSNVDVSAVYTIENNLAPILSESYGLCEADLGTAGNQFYGGAASGFPTTGIWTQAAAQGITVLLATGDAGSSVCDPLDPNVALDQPAQFGLEVSGLASTPYDTAVGGTDFNQVTNPTAYWNTSDTSSTTHLSAKGYIPEMTWNDSCTNIIWNTAGGYSTNPEANCVTFSSIKAQEFFVYPIGGGGGMSSCITGNGANSLGVPDLTCAGGGYPKPSWQVAPGVPNDTKRDIPDISLFSGDGLMGSFYIVCQKDGAQNVQGNPVDNTYCTASDLASLSGVGGTSASVQVFAGIMALVNQHMATVKNNANYRVGLANPVLYQLAQQQSQSGTSCNSSAPASTCVFNDVTVGTIAQPCVKGTPNCSVSSSSDSIGILTCCDASTGYDLTTGLGSVNVANLVNGWNGATGSSAADFWLSLGSGNGTVVIPAPGDSSSFTFTVTAVNSFTGAYTYSCSGLPTLTTCSFAPTTNGANTSVVVTVSTASTGMMVPASRPVGIGWWRPVGAMSLACVLCAAFLLLGLQWKSRRFATVAALLVFAVVLMGVGGCGPGAGTGGGGGGGGGTPAGFYTPTVSAVSGNVTHSLNFNLSVR